MNTRRLSPRLRLLVLLCVLQGSLLVGCGNESQVEDEAVSNAGAQNSAGAVSADTNPVSAIESTSVDESIEQKPAEKTVSMVERHPPSLHFKMDENAANASVFDATEGQHSQTFLDSGGNPSTDAHSVPGVVGTALAFDGADDSIIIPQAQVGDLFGAGSDFAVAFWWRSDSDFSPGYKQVLSNHGADSGGIILYHWSNEHGAQRNIRTNFYLPGEGAPILSASLAIAENTSEWHHFVFQRRGSMLQAWHDGILRDSYSDPKASGNMGGGRDLKVSPIGQGAAGALDELRLYPHALLQSKIVSLAQNQPETSDLFSLVEELGYLDTGSQADAAEVARIQRAIQTELAAQKGYQKQIGEDMELLAFQFSQINSDLCEIKLAFRANAQLDTDYHVSIRSFYDASHALRVPKKNRTPDGGQRWSILTEPATSTWSSGEVVVIIDHVEAIEIPYQISLNLMYLHADEKMGWQRKIPEFVELGWHIGF